MTTYPAASAASFAPFARSVKNGFEISGTTNPRTRVLPARRVRAEALGTKPKSEMAFWTFFKVAGAKISGRLIAFETVPRETPAFRATSLILTLIIETIQENFN